MTFRFVEPRVPAAVCRAADGRTRGSACRILFGELAGAASALVPAAAAPAAALEAGSGRVQTGATFEDPALHAALAGALPPASAAALRQRFEWYGCFGAFFHNDAHYDGVMFGVLAIVGPERDVYFPRVDVRASALPGSWTVFDPFEPHGVVATGRRTWQRDDYVDQTPTLFVGFEVELTAAVASEFGIAASSTLPADAVELSSRSAIHAETGAVG